MSIIRGLAVEILDIFDIMQQLFLVHQP